jgi:hypothetical protein
MAGRVKHAQRSHKTYSKNYSEFHSFKIRSGGKDSIRQIRSSVFERLLSLFKHQGR